MSSLLTVGAGCTAARAPEHAGAPVAVVLDRRDSAFVAAVDASARSRVAMDSLSGVVVLARGDTPIYVLTTGFADRERGEPNRSNTKFNLASNDKYFTRIAIRQLQEAGKLRMSDTVGRFLPDYPNERVRRAVTVAQLYDMRSGLGDFTQSGSRDFHAKRLTLRTIDDYLALFAHDSLLSAPGTATHYSNAGYVLLGKIIEVASGETYYDYVRDHIFRPAGMVNTGYYTLDELDRVPNIAEPYTLSADAAGDLGDDAAPSGARRSARPLLPYRGSSAGGGYSTAEDLLRLTHALTTNSLMSRAYTDSLMSFRLPGRPRVFDPRDPLAWADGWTGGSEGVNTVYYMHATGHTLIVLSNFDPPSATAFRRKLWNEWIPQYGAADGP